jgi:N-acetylglucosaminyldiphosphoundecaprenol N-acetyl-beta-D-mannosaminyltransferase
MTEPPRLTIGNLRVHPLTLEQALDRVLALAAARKAAYVVTPNADHVVRAETDAAFAKICEEADLVLADGMPLVWASRWLGARLPERVAGSDLMPGLCARAAATGARVFLLGGLAGEAELAAARLTAKFPGLQVAGTYFPPFGFDRDEAECRRIVAAINDARADLVFVGVGSPKQEAWIARWRSELACGVLLGIGTTIAFEAGTMPRAPRWMQHVGAEWLFRLAREPRRLARRYAHDLRFFLIAWRSWRQATGRTVHKPEDHGRR